MSLLRKIRSATPAKLVRKALAKGWFNWAPDPLYLRLMYFGYMGGRILHLNHPRRYNEKLQWMKIYDRRDIYTTMVDKADAKTYVAERIGDEYIIKTYGVWNAPEEIDYDSLPDKFVLKTTHDSGGIKIVDKREGFDKEELNRFFRDRLSRNMYKITREWPYKNVKPRIIAEEYLEDAETQELRDYKFFCFDGVVRALFVATDRQNPDKPTAFDFFDTDYNDLHIINGHPNADVLPKKPATFEKMKELAAILSKGFPQLRVDFYEVNGKLYFGELTLFHHGGICPFEPDYWDYTFGEWYQIDKDAVKSIEKK